MVDARRIWIRWFLAGALCLGAGGCAFAQFGAHGPRPPHFVQVQSPQSGSLAGRLTDLHSSPLAGVSVVLHNQATGAEIHTTTAKNGAFRFASLDAGEYTLEADAAGLGHGRLEGILVTGGIEARVQAAMHFEPTPPGQAGAPALLEAAAPTQIAAPSPATTATSTSLTVSKPAMIAEPSPSAPLNAPGPALSTSNPPIIASIAAEPLRPMPFTVASTGDAIRPSAQPMTQVRTPPQIVTQLTAPTQSAPRAASPPAISAPAAQPATRIPPAPQHAQPTIHTPAPPQRAALDTQPVAIELALAIAQPRMFPVRAALTPALAATAMSTSALQAVMLNPPPVVASMAAEQAPDPVTPAAATTVTAAQLQSLPAGGRRWQEFLLDTPAASASADSSQASYRGSQESAEITVDGANRRLAFGAAAGSGSRVSDPAGADQQGSVSPSGSQAWNGGRGLGVSEAAIREVTTAAGNVEAEGMRSAGGRTTIRTQSGGNALHGQGFLFDRQNTWGARNPFTQWVQNTGSASAPTFTGAPFTPPDHEIVWGLGMGSRIRRDKLFWFAALDGNRRNDPGLATVKHPDQFFAQPSNAQMQLLSAQLGLSSANPVAEGLAAYWPMLETLDGLLGPAQRTSAQWLGFGRIDWQADERHHFTLEGIGADWSAPGGGLTHTAESYGSHSFGSREASQQWLLARWEAYLTPNLLAVTQGSAGRAVLSAKPDTPSALEQSFLSGNFWGQLPQIVVDSRYGFTIGNPSRFGKGDYPDERHYHGQEMLDWAHNKLLVRAGFELDHNADAISQLRNQTGTYVYSKVEDFVSDALAFEKFGFADALDPGSPHNCGPTGTTFGSQPCYSHYSQTIGPTNWRLSTNDWAGYVNAQWQLNKLAVFSAGLRWEREQMPPPIAALANPDLPVTGKLPAPGNNWGPRFSLAIGEAQGRWPVLRLGYGMYYGRTANATIETALTQTGSLKGDLNFFMRPTDDCQHCSGGSPPFPYVFSGQPSSVVKPGAVEFAPNFRNPQVHQAIAAIEQALPGRVELTAGAMLSLGRRLPVFIDTNLASPPIVPQSQQLQSITYTVCDQVPTGPGNGVCGNLGLGPIKATRVTVPFYASTPSASVAGWLNPNYQQIDQITSMANSTYEAAMVKLARNGRRGLSLHAHYTYAHAMDWNPDQSPLDPASLSPQSDFRQEYGTSNLDVRHSAAVMAIYEAPWKLHDFAGRLLNGWMLSGIGQFRSGLPYTMRVSGSLAEESIANGTMVGLRPGMNGSGGDSRVYGFGNDGQVYNIGRNTFRHPNTWKADLRLAKRFDLGETRQLELLAESFNLFNHQNVTEIETTGYTIARGSPFPTLNFLTGLKTNRTTGLPIPAFGQPLNINATDFYRERQIQLGLRMRF